jgi:hypothetical protein
MTLEFIRNLIQSAVNYNIQITLIMLSCLVLVYTIIVSALKQAWARYAFLIVIGIGLYFASTVMDNKINREFFSGLSTELFGAAIALVILGKWMLPSLWSLVILSPVVIIGELLIFQIKDAAMQSYYLGISSNIWGAFLVAILLEELVHKREDNKVSGELLSHRQKMHLKNLALDLEIADLEKQVTEAALQQKELHKERLKIAAQTMHPAGWNIEIRVHGRNHEELRNRMLRVRQIMHVVHVSSFYTNALGEQCHCYVRASINKFPTQANGNGKTWAALSATALQKDVQEEINHNQTSNNGKMPPTLAPSPTNNDHRDI